MESKVITKGELGKNSESELPNSLYLINMAFNGLSGI